MLLSDLVRCHVLAQSQAPRLADNSSDVRPGVIIGLLDQRLHVDILSQRHLFQVNLEDLLPRLLIRDRGHDQLVKAAWP